MKKTLLRRESSHPITADKLDESLIKKMTLTDLPIGATAKILAINGNNVITRRLMEMGVVPGVVVRVIKSAPFGDPLEVRVRGYHLAMRKSEADTIEVQSPKS